ncbi:hypothetical protein ACIHCQ_26925 [Streptomyces sp. NPDC052236]|uniref:hypothetical protein n=1 Tax=Streptomyces sp. NPDC052236 TaxID=3365686 RepID=UPI0037D4EDA7
MPPFALPRAPSSAPGPPVPVLLPEYRERDKSSRDHDGEYATYPRTPPSTRRPGGEPAAFLGLGGDLDIRMQGAPDGHARIVGHALGASGRRAGGGGHGAVAR